MSETQAIIGRLLGSFQLNVQLFFLTLLFSLPLGLLIAFGSMSKWKPLSALTRTIVWIVRGTPLMLQVVIIFFAPGLMGWGSPWGSGASARFTAATVAFVVNYGCYFSEIFRGGIEGVPHGQMEAGQVLGMTRGQIFRRITLLQVIKRILPAMSNEVITLVKDTSLARIISIKEILMMAQEYTAQGLIWPLFSTGLFFLAFVGLLTLLFSRLEKRLSYFRA